METTRTAYEIETLLREIAAREDCGEESDEIVTTEDGEKCIDCIEAEKFYCG